MLIFLYSIELDENKVLENKVFKQELSVTKTWINFIIKQFHCSENCLVKSNWHAQS